MGGLLALLLFFTTRCLASENLFLVSNVTTVDGYLPVNTTAVVLSWDGDAKAGRMSYVVRYTFEWEDESAYQTVLDTTESVLNGTKSSCRVYCSSLGQGAWWVTHTRSIFARPGALSLSLPLRASLVHQLRRYLPSEDGQRQFSLSSDDGHQHVLQRHKQQCAAGVDSEWDDLQPCPSPILPLWSG